MKNNCTGQFESLGESSLVGDCIDRLSNLPDSVLYHVISFLDTKYAVQTSVLSRRWRCAWKHLPVLKMYDSSFKRTSDFRTFVDKVLSLRYQINVNKICYMDVQDPVGMELHDRVVEYAFSHHAQHFDIAVDQYNVMFTYLFDSIVNCDLKTLEVGWIWFDAGSYCFQKLTTLKLSCCMLDDLEQGYDLSLNFPLLTSLEISHCSSDTVVKVYAPRLLDLKLAGFDGPLIEIVAPKLKLVSVRIWVTHRNYFGLLKFSLPYVNHAEIWMDKHNNPHEKSLVSHFNSLFPCLHNAKSLLLGCHSTKTLTEICVFLEQTPSCFTNLESLVCVSNDPYEVVKYQVEGPCDQEPNAKCFRRQQSVTSV